MIGYHSCGTRLPLLNVEKEMNVTYILERLFGWLHRPSVIVYGKHS